MNEKLAELETRIGYSFDDMDLLKQALSHSSYINERLDERLSSYERLEFLGDAVLELAVSEHLLLSDLAMNEGELTKSRSQFVCEQTLAKCAREFSLGDYLFLGRGERANGGHERSSMLCDVMESLIGAIYLDGGFEAAKDFISRVVLTDKIKETPAMDSKSSLQELVAKKKPGKLEYRMVAVRGPDHVREFEVELYLDEKKIGAGKGSSKKNAEQDAARMALLGEDFVCT